MQEDVAKRPAARARTSGKGDDKGRLPKRRKEGPQTGACFLAALADLKLLAIAIYLLMKRRVTPGVATCDFFMRRATSSLPWAQPEVTPGGRRHPLISGTLEYRRHVPRGAGRHGP